MHPLHLPAITTILLMCWLSLPLQTARRFIYHRGYIVPPSASRCQYISGHNAANVGEIVCQAVRLHNPLNVGEVTDCIDVASHTIIASGLCPYSYPTIPSAPHPIQFVYDDTQGTPVIYDCNLVRSSSFAVFGWILVSLTQIFTVRKFTH